MWLPSGLNLSPAECRVYAYIYGLTEGRVYNYINGRLTKCKPSTTKGYKGSVRQLAKTLGLDDSGVSRILRKLQDKQLVLTNDGAFMSADIFRSSADSVRSGADLISSDADSVRESADSVRPLNNPLYKEINKEENREEITREENSDASLSPQEDFFLVTLAAFGLQAGARNVTRKQEQLARAAWQRYSPEQQQALLDAIRKGYSVKGNFQFTVEDFLREHSQPEPDPQGEPTNYNGCDPPKEPTFVACYKGEWGLYTLADIQKFNLKTKAKQ